MSSPEIQPRLDQLTRADLIRRVGSLEEAYQFKHNLIQESAYASLLKNDRRALHRACAEALERAFPDALDEYAALLAKHFAEAGDDANSLRYARRAGQAAVRVSAYAEALMHYDMAAQLAGRLALDADTFTALHLERGRTLELMGKYAQAIDAYRALEQSGQTRNEPQMEMSARLSLATLYTFPNPAQDLDKALGANQNALTLARAINDESAQARALWNLQQHAYFTGNASDAVAYSKQALAIADRLGLRELRAYILNDLSRSLVTAESVPAALNALAEAREIFRVYNNLPMLADNFSTSAETAQVGGKIELAQDFAQQARELSVLINNVWNLAYSNTSLLTIAGQCGEYTKALSLCHQTLQLAEQSGFIIAAQVAQVQIALIYGELGDAARGIALMEQPDVQDTIPMLAAWHFGGLLNLYMLQGNIPAARAALTSAQTLVHTDDLSTYGPIFVALGTAEIALHEQRYAQAVTPTRELAARLRHLQFHFFLPDLLLRQARAHLGLREWDAAANILQEAKGLAHEMNVRPVLWELFATQSALAREQGDTLLAQTCQLQARAIVAELTEHVPVEYRDRYLAQPKIRALYETIH